MPEVEGERRGAICLQDALGERLTAGEDAHCTTPPGTGDRRQTIIQDALSGVDAPAAQHAPRAATRYAAPNREMGMGQDVVAAIGWVDAGTSARLALGMHEEVNGQPVWGAKGWGRCVGGGARV